MNFHEHVRRLIAGSWPAAGRRLARRLLRSMSDQHPEFGSIEHLMRDLMQQDPSAQTWYSYRTAAQDLNTHPWVNKAIHIWSDSLAPLPLLILRPGGQSDREHALIRLLDHPNAHMTATDLWREWAI